MTTPAPSKPYPIRPSEIGREVLLPRTLPVRSRADLTPYHWVPGPDGRCSLRRGAPPKAAKRAVAEFAAGKTSLGDMLDRLGVPKA